ncbi:hypothetical protein B0T26DRAFT_407036 [Lasiosphaeria miniovina]|uniref:Secreted protein n=1 Tax=Lasiosphaeria miniovina TaxID=1954250 RepID=A0AA40A515_9PEZI|nr:uncharacterized protein B0T26DRAFT_407036 [Lasiosphaeria miniovina]KAK0709463.1 hypothetical protein B0T26DRAFT_407036 [Lasiosphaeria miniovina]
MRAAHQKQVIILVTLFCSVNPVSSLLRRCRHPLHIPSLTLPPPWRAPWSPQRSVGNYTLPSHASSSSRLMTFLSNQVPPVEPTDNSGNCYSLSLPSTSLQASQHHPKCLPTCPEVHTSKLES